MLRLSEYRNAMMLEQAVGQRRFGHFDSDANKAIGPEPTTWPIVSTRQASSDGPLVPAPIAKVNRRTGRVTYSDSSSRAR